jgi:hypothetical protein
MEQLVAESTGKLGKGIVPAPDDPRAELHEDVALPSPYELGQEFFRWEFAVVVAGSILGINPFDQPDVQAAKDKTNQVLARATSSSSRRARSTSCSRRRARRLRLHPGVRRSRARASCSRSSTRRARAGTSSRTARAALPPLDGQFHKGGRTRSLPPGRRRHRRRAADSRARASASRG